MDSTENSGEQATARERGRLSHRSTSGAGFHFEDLVAAYLLAQSLAREPSIGLGAPATTLQFQTRALRWEIDDLLATAEGEYGTRRAAYSCKSNLQVSRAGLPPEFVTSAWLQWRQGDPFNEETDVLALVPLGHDDRFEAAWAQISDWCSGGATDLACARLAKASGAVKSIFVGVRTAGAEADVLPSEAEAVELIRHLRVLPLDLGRESSRTEAEALRLCRHILDPKSSTRALELWTELIRRGGEARRTHGNIGIDDLWRELCRDFAFKDHPNHSHSWSRLDQLSADHRADIETELPSGHRVARTALAGRLASVLRADGICVAFGDSGAGKSALVKATLDDEFGEARQVWMGPEILADALSEAKRGALGLDRPLDEVLEHSTSGCNVFVLDAAERLDASTLNRARDLIRQLLPSGSHSPATWRIVIVGQTDSSDGRLQTLSSSMAQSVEVGPLAPEEVLLALRSSPALCGFLDDPVVPRLLRNIRTLTLVIRACEAFSGSAQPTSHVDIANRLFDYWTERRVQLQGFLIRLSIREAQFERSFAISEFDAVDLRALDQAPAQFPLVQRHGRIEFQDDLVPDWVRFERLKELSAKPEEWSKLAAEPLWVPALRLFGQFLLRHDERGANTWDHAFRSAREGGLTSAQDVLLDALCLDPEADRFMEARTDLLFQDQAALLERLLRRFLHVATVAQVPESLADPSLRFYLEGSIRVPIYGRWPPLLRFLEAQADRLAALGSQTVAQLCELWLRTTPLDLSENVPTPFRSAVADLALANAETIWVQRAARHTFGGGEWGRTIYSAALSAAPDRPNAVAAFALQLANRRPWDEQIINRIARFQEADRKARKAALAADPERRRREEERRTTQVPHFPTLERDLPPWPLGATARLDADFRHSIVHGGALKPLMSVQPGIASEVLLACIIDDNPKEDSSRFDFDRKLGLEFDSEASPVIYWKSPFYAFLQLTPAEAKSAILRLVDFCTERWAHGMGFQGEPPSLSLVLDADPPQSYIGDYQVFDWPQGSGYSAGQLYSALDALERWLCDRIDAGADVAADCRELLAGCRSVSILGLLTNVGKKQPSLLASVLSPMLAQPRLYWWDDRRIAHNDFRYDGLSWWRAGELATNMAREWIFAPHRRIALRAVVRDLRRSDPQFEQQLSALVSAWPQPEEEAAALNQRILAAELNPANWHWDDEVNPTSEQRCTFSLPDHLQQAVRAIDQRERPDADRDPTASEIIHHCREILPQRGTLTDEYAEYLFGLLARHDEPKDEVERSTARAALATALLVKGWDWLGRNAAAQAEAAGAIKAFVEGQESARPEDRGGRMLWGQALALVGLAAANRLAAGDDNDALWQRVLRAVVSSGNPGAMGTVIAALRLYREQLPSLWLKILRLGIFTAALEALTPRYGDEEGAEERLQQWRGRLRQWPLDGDAESLEDWDFRGLAERVERIWRGRMVRLHKRDDWRGNVRQRFSNGLDIPSLQALFAWALSEDVTPPHGERAEHWLALQKLWEFEAWNLLRGHEEDDSTDELSQVTELGFSIIRVIASRTAVGPADESCILWEPILGLGGRGGFNVEHFVDCFFLRLYKQHDPSAFVTSWRAMLVQAFQPSWKATGRWYRARDIRKHLLGFNAANQLAHSPPVLHQLPSLLEFYRTFAAQELAHDDRAIEGVSYFLASAAGSAFRLEGIFWLESATRESGRLRKETTGAITEFVDRVLTDHDTDLLADGEARAALIRLVAQLVEAQAPLALALQERIRALR